MGLKTFGLMAVDWEERVDFERLRTERLARAKRLLAESELGALLCFDMNNIRYITATHIGTWAIDKLARFTLLPQDDEPILWDFGSAARHHQLYCPWLGERSRPGHLDAARRDGARGRPAPRTSRARSASSSSSAACWASRSAWTSSSLPVLFALQAEGITVVDGQQLMQQARVIKTEDEITLLNTACMMVDAAYDELYRAMKPGMRENECVGLVSKVLYDLGSEHVEGVNAISGERCSPHPHVFADRDPAPRRSGVLRHPARLHGLPHLLLPHVRGRQRLERAGRRLQALPRLPRRGHLADPARRDDRGGRVEVWPKAEEFGFANEEAAFALQYGHGIGLSIWEKPIFSRLVSLEHPEVIEEGMVFALETFWPASDGWSRRAHRGGARGHGDGLRGHHALPGRGAARGGHALPRRQRTAVGHTRDAVPPQREQRLRAAPRRRSRGHPALSVATDVIMPALGVAQDSGRVVRWLLGEGDPVRKHEPLIEIETDKVTVELEAPADGTLAAITAHVGDDVAVGSVIALILAPGEVPPRGGAARPACGLAGRPAHGARGGRRPGGPRGHPRAPGSGRRRAGGRRRGRGARRARGSAAARGGHHRPRQPHLARDGRAHGRELDDNTAFRAPAADQREPTADLEGASA